MTEQAKLAPAQIGRHGGFIPWEVHLAAYEVYCEVFESQPALIDLEGRNCRGGFGELELIAFLYARSFPRNEWRKRADEIFDNSMKLVR
jgi:hypothetical protein